VNKEVAWHCCYIGGSLSLSIRCLGLVLALAITSDLALTQSAITLCDLVVKQVPNMGHKLISRRESATRVTVEKKISARRVLFPNRVVDRQTGKDQVDLIEFGY
jgi:hypothetical protein